MRGFPTVFRKEKHERSVFRQNFERRSMKGLYKDETLQKILSYFLIFIEIILMSVAFDAEASLPVKIALFAVGFLMWLVSDSVLRKIRNGQTDTKSADIFMKMNCGLFVLFFSAGIIGSIYAFATARKTLMEENENRAYNTSVVQKKYLDYENFDFASAEIDSEARPETVSSYILLRDREWNKPNWPRYWELSYSAPVGEKERYTQEDLDSFDVIVYAVSDYQSGYYRQGTMEGYVTSESVSLYYYNPIAGSFFAIGRIEGEKLKKTEDTWHHEIDLYEVIKKAEKDIHYHNIREDSIGAKITKCVIGFFGAYYVLGFIYRRIKKGKTN